MNAGGPRVIRNRQMSPQSGMSGLSVASSVVGTRTYVLSSLGTLHSSRNGRVIEEVIEDPYQSNNIRDQSNSSRSRPRPHGQVQRIDSSI